MVDVRQWATQPAIRTGLGTAVGYLLILAILTIVLFGIPWAIFAFS